MPSPCFSTVGRTYTPGAKRYEVKVIMNYRAMNLVFFFSELGSRQMQKYKR